MQYDSVQKKKSLLNKISLSIYIRIYIRVGQLGFSKFGFLISYKVLKI